MSEKRKSTPKAKVLTAVLLILFLGSCAVLIFAVCTDILGINSNTNPTETITPTETSAIVSTTASIPATIPSSSVLPTTASEVSDAGVNLGSIYEVDYWVEYMAEKGAPGLGVLFGARTQGAVVTFEEDRFTVSNLNYDEYVPVVSGTFSFVSDNEIELRFDNSNIEIATVLDAENGVATVIDFPMDLEDTTLRLSLTD